MDFSRYINKNYFQLATTLRQFVIVNHKVRRMYKNFTTLYKSLHWNITSFIVLNMAVESTALRIGTLVFLLITGIRFPASDSLIVA